MNLKSVFIKYCFLSIVVGAFMNIAPSTLAANKTPQNTSHPSDLYQNLDRLKFSNYSRQTIDIVATRSAVSPKTIELVKQFEGFRSRAYIDTSGYAVIGYGQSRINGRRVRMGQYITQAQAEAALEQELAHIQKTVLAHVKVELNQYQLGALTSLVYNSGVRVLKKSTLIRKLNAGDYAAASREFVRWNKANRGGRLVVFPGLTRRRLAEQKLFLTPYIQVASNS